MANFPKTKEEIKKLLFQNLKITSIFIGFSVLLGFWLLSERGGSPPLSQKTEKPPVGSFKEAIDPRALWSESLAKQMEALTKKVEATLAHTTQNTQEVLSSLKNDVERLKTQQASPSVPVLQEAKIRVFDEQPKSQKPPKKLAHLHQVFSKTDRKDTEAYVASGAFARAVLLTGVVADTGTEASGSPQPILLRLVDHGIFSKGYQTKQIKEAIIIGSCYGNISSERALCRLEKFSLVNQDQDIIERPVKGWVIGEDGRPGLKGEVVDKTSDVTRMAVLNGILGGIAGFFQNQATSSIYPVSALTGPSQALKGMDSLKAGASSGVGNALQKLADYAIKKAEQMNPVIMVGAGRVVDVVFKKGFDIKESPSANKTALKTVTSISSTSEKTLEESSTFPYQRENGGAQGPHSLKDLPINEALPKGSF